MKHYDWFVWLALSSILSSGAVSAQTCVSPPANIVAWWTLDEPPAVLPTTRSGLNQRLTLARRPRCQCPASSRGR